MEQHDTISIVVIGPAGQGKSSLINIILNENKASVGNDLDGVTKYISEYETFLDQTNLKLILYDLPGFGDIDINVHKLAEQWNNVLSDKKIDLIFFCYQISNTRMDIITRMSLNIMVKCLKNPMIEKSFVIVVTQVDLMNEEGIDNFKNDFLINQLIPKLKTQINASEINQVIYTSNKKKEETIQQVLQICQKYLYENKMFRIGLLGETQQGQISLINTFLEQKIINQSETQIIENVITNYQIQGMQIEFVLIQYKKDISQQNLVKEWCNMYGYKKLNMLFVFLKQNDEDMDILTDFQLSKYQEILEHKSLNQSYSIFINSNNSIVDINRRQKKIIELLKKINIAIPQQIYILLSNLDSKNIKKDLENCVTRYEVAREHSKNTTVIKMEKQIIIEAEQKMAEHNGSFCISLNSKILTNEGYDDISRLKEGQIILVRNNDRIETDKIICFIHMNLSESTKFIKIIFQNNEFITITPNHLIKLYSQTFIQAKFIKKGYLIERVNGSEIYPDLVVEVQDLYEQGYTCPLSSSGQLIINGCVVSCYSNCSQLVGDIFTWPIRNIQIIRYMFKQKENSEEIHPYFKFLLSLNKYLMIAKD